MDMSVTIIIGKPVETVFAYVSDTSNDVNWRIGLTGSGLRSGDTMEVGTIGYTRVGDKEIEWRVVSYSASSLSERVNFAAELPLLRPII